MKLEDIEKLTLESHEEMFRQQISFEKDIDKEDVTLDEIVQAFDEYKEDLISAENVRLAEVERLRTLQIRVEALGKDYGELVNKYLEGKTHNYGGYNPAAFDKHNVDKADCKFWRYDIPKPTLEQLEAIRKDIQNIKYAKDIERKWKEFRSKRDSALSKTDFTQLADAPLTSEEKTQYRAYRKYLRELPLQHNQSSIDSAVIKTFDEFKADL